jgi:hypothetical protein
MEHIFVLLYGPNHLSSYFGQHVTVEDSYLCGYLKIKGLTEVCS